MPRTRAFSFFRRGMRRPAQNNRGEEAARKTGRLFVDGVAAYAGTFTDQRPFIENVGPSAEKTVGRCCPLRFPGESAVKKAPPPALAPFRRRCRTHQNPPYSLSDGRTAFPAEAPRAVSANPLREVPPTAFAPPVSGSAAPVFGPPSSRPAV